MVNSELMEVIKATKRDRWTFSRIAKVALVHCEVLWVLATMQINGLPSYLEEQKGQKSWMDSKCSFVTFCAQRKHGKSTARNTMRSLSRVFLTDGTRDWMSFPSRFSQFSSMKSHDSKECFKHNLHLKRKGGIVTSKRLCQNSAYVHSKCMNTKFYFLKKY